MKIQINHLAKMEGHAGFVGHILEGNVALAKIETQEGARLIEGMLIGRHYMDAPIITARICGICPVVHNLTAIESLEKALEVKVTDQTRTLRKLMQYSQIIHSHGLHLFFLSLPDFYGILNDLQLIKKHPKEADMAMDIRRWATDLIRLIGGRTVHPITSQVGGFKILPAQEDLDEINDRLPALIKKAEKLVKLFIKLNYPELNRKTEYICLFNDKEYGIYSGDIKSSEEETISSTKFSKKITEIKKQYEAVKKAKLSGKSFMVGAIARLNNNHSQLNPRAKALLKESGVKLPTYNSFYNILAQAVELVHMLEESQKILKDLKLKEEGQVEYRVKECFAVAAMEAPRGTLFHYYKLDKDGIIQDCNIITPTAQFLFNLEDDLAMYLPNIKDMTAKERRQKIRLLIRAYDPCISCATH
ncbi:Ni/Fe hydrogenase subunit alpha [Patescibacteria group bacterium]|nr:Ni/Fe hydrogenase subunit alpha [Patescibacteria group bacterium]